MRSAVAAAPWAPSGLEDAPPRVVRGPARLVRGWAGALAMTALAASSVSTRTIRARNRDRLTSISAVASRPGTR